MKKRTKDILELLQTTEKSVTISYLAALHHVSERTIRNDLNSINEWLGQNGFRLIRLGSSGRIEYQPETAVSDKLALENDLYTYKLSKEERRQLIAAILVSSSGYTTLASIAEMLFVSRVTIINDLEEVKRFLEREHLKVVSHSSKGIRVEGSEKGKRRLLLLLSRYGREYGQPDFTRNTRSILTGIDGGEEDTIRKIVNEQEHVYKIVLTDDSFRELVSYLEILLKRVRQGAVVEPEKTLYNGYYPMASGILKYLSRSCRMDIPEAETIYLSFLLSRLRYLKKDEFDGNIVKTQLITRQFIEAVSKTLEMDFKQDYIFYENLANHLQSIFESGELPFEENPGLEAIVRENREIWQAAMDSKEIIEKYIRRPLGSMELNYIAVHICAAVERRKNNETALHVILVCHAGIGTSQLLLERLRKHFQFRVAEVMSAHEVKRIRKGQADLVISTVRLPECEIDSVVVTPALSDDDYLRVGHLIDDIRSRKRCQSLSTPVGNSPEDLMNVIKPIIRQYKEESAEVLIDKVEEAVKQYFNRGESAEEPARPPMLCHLLTPDRILLEADCRDWREAVRVSADRLLAAGVIEERYVSAMIHNIEENGPYVVISPGFALPHDGADSGTKGVGMNLIRLKEPVAFGDEDAVPVRFVCCLSAVDHDRHLPAFFHLVNLLQNREFKEMLEQSRTPEEMAEGIGRFENMLILSKETCTSL